MTATVLVYVLLLPVSTWWLGSVLGLLDEPDPALALRRVAWRSLPFLLAALLLGHRAAAPVAAAVATSLILHLSWSWGVQTATRRGWLLADPEE